MKKYGLTGLTIVAVLAFVLSCYFTLGYAPREAVMGDVQRIFYQHVSLGWLFSLAFFVTLVTGIAYLFTKHWYWDALALASAEIGVLFTLLNIISGAIWSRPIWNTWWTWDPRLTTATVTLLLYLAYLLLRQAIDDPQRRARFASIYGILAFVSVPLTVYSIRIWRTIHPVILGSGDPTAQGQFNMTPPMVTTLLLNVLAFTIGYCALVSWRLRLETQQQQLAQRKVQFADQQLGTLS
jgi:heme exporter protein C